MSESREVRNKRVAIDAIGLLDRCAYFLGAEAVREVEAFHQRWDDRGVLWTRPTMQPFDLDEWLPATEMAARADTEPATVRRWHLRGHITAATIGGLLHYNVGEVVAYLAKRDRTRRTQ